MTCVRNRKIVKSRMKSFRQALNERSLLLFAGAMGTELYRRGLFINRSFEEMNLGNGQLIKEIQRQQIRVVQTSAFLAGAGIPHRLQTIGMLQDMNGKPNQA